MNCALTYTHITLLHKAKQLAERLQLPLVEFHASKCPVLLILTETCLELRLTVKNAPGAIAVDFLSGKSNYRRQYGGGRGQLIAKAVGVQSKQKLSVLDVTAGLGQDAFVLACLGCQVVMCERSSIVHALLQDGLERAQKEEWFKYLSLSLVHVDALGYLSLYHENNKPDVIYIDPMFPERIKSALVKKEMRVLRAVVGDDIDARLLLEQALQTAKKRVVVKRSKLAPTLNDRKPDLIYSGKSCRFDVYFPRDF